MSTLVNQYGVGGSVDAGTLAFVQIHPWGGGSTTWGADRATFYGVSGTPMNWWDGWDLDYGGWGNYTQDYNTYHASYLSHVDDPTDVTIVLNGSVVAGQTYEITATVCVEAGGTAKDMRIYLTQVLDYWPFTPTYHRNGFKQAANTVDYHFNAGQCRDIVHDFTFDTDSWNNQDDIKIIAWAQEQLGSGPADVYQAAVMVWPFMMDCQPNGILDECDLDCGDPGGPCDVPGCGGSLDCDTNGVPDECQTDCNENDIPDTCDITAGTSDDYDLNGIPDECDVDCNTNGVPDTCDTDCATGNCASHPLGCEGPPNCNGNAIPDECELDGNDCNVNDVPDECDIAGTTSVDCQPNGVPDECELGSNDCNGNSIPDSCDIDAGTSWDCQLNGEPDECELGGNDCNTNGVPDECDPDCNTNSVPDDCDIANETSNDCNGNSVPDECDAVLCTNVWDGFQADPPFVPYGGVHGIDFVAGDGSVWDNPSGSATVRSAGCETGESDDYMIRVTSPSEDPQDAYITSEYFETDAGELPPEAYVYALSFHPRIDVNIDSKYDWEFLLYDAESDDVVVQIEFASINGTVGDPGYVPGHILVNTNDVFYPEYADTGVLIELATCYDIEVVLDNRRDAAEAVEVYVNGELKVTTKRLKANTHRLDYFKLMLVDSSAAPDYLTRFILDGFDLCTTGTLQPPSAYDCNGNGQLDECDIASVRSHDCNANGVPDDCEDFLGMGDFDGNETINLLDYNEFQACLTAPDVPFGAGCDEGDFDCDGDIDLRNFSDFQEVFDGV